MARRAGSIRMYCDGEPLVFSRGEYWVPVHHAPPPEPQRVLV